MRDPDRLSGYISTTSVHRQYTRAMGSEIRDPFWVSLLKPLDYSHSKSNRRSLLPNKQMSASWRTYMTRVLGIDPLESPWIPEAPCFQPQYSSSL